MMDLGALEDAGHHVEMMSGVFMGRMCVGAQAFFVMYERTDEGLWRDGRVVDGRLKSIVRFRTGAQPPLSVIAC